MDQFVTIKNTRHNIIAQWFEKLDLTIVVGDKVHDNIMSDIAADTQLSVMVNNNALFTYDMYSVEKQLINGRIAITFSEGK